MSSPIVRLNTTDLEHLLQLVEVKLEAALTQMERVDLNVIRKKLHLQLRNSHYEKPKPFPKNYVPPTTFIPGYEQLTTGDSNDSTGE